MEREYNRNRSSWHLRRNDNREDYRPGREKRQDHTGYGERREWRERRNAGFRNENDRSENSRPKRYDARNFSEDRERYRPFERGNDRRPSSYPDRMRRNEYPVNRNRGEGNGAGYRQERQGDFRETGRERPQAFRDGEYRENYRAGWRNRTERTEEERSGRKERPYGRREYVGSEEGSEKLRQRHYSKKKILAHRLKHADEQAELRLNRFISMGGICSRRDADELIVAGRVKVNGGIVQTVGTKVHRSDKGEVDDVQVFPEKKVYLVLNKPKDYVTTVEDPLERKTVMTLVENACKERIYPVGRLDRQTMGVLLFTNDGDLVKKLTHPKYEQKKIYHVFLDKPLAEQDLEAVTAGVDLEDGFVKADEISYASEDGMEVGIEIHSGKNRIVRRIFEHLGYQIVKLDRVYFAGITKKNLPRGRWRFLTDQEVNMLKVY